MGGVQPIAMACGATFVTSSPCSHKPSVGGDLLGHGSKLPHTPQNLINRRYKCPTGEIAAFSRRKNFPRKSFCLFLSLLY